MQPQTKHRQRSRTNRALSTSADIRKHRQSVNISHHTHLTTKFKWRYNQNKQQREREREREVWDKDRECSRDREYSCILYACSYMQIPSTYREPHTQTHTHTHVCMGSTDRRKSLDTPGTQLSCPRSLLPTTFSTKPNLAQKLGSFWWVPLQLQQELHCWVSILGPLILEKGVLIRRALRFVVYIRDPEFIETPALSFLSGSESVTSLPEMGPAGECDMAPRRRSRSRMYLL